MGLVRLIRPTSPIHDSPGARLLFKRFLNARMFRLAVVNRARWADHIVSEIEVQLAVLDHLDHECRQVARVYLAGVNRDGRGKIERSHNHHAVYVNRLAGFAQYAVASGRTREIYND